MKKYVITLAKTFQKGHPKQGEETHFREHVLQAIESPRDFTGNIKYSVKVHTIRTNYPLWEKRIKEIQEGKAVLAIRQWSGLPYRSPQEDIIELTNVGIQKLEFTRLGFSFRPLIDGNLYACFSSVARHDGLTYIDWLDWFEKVDITKPLAIIHFTNFRY